MKMLTSVVTLANSIIGVSILAMPYCFKQCGILLAALMIILSGVLVKLACHLLLKSAMLARRRNFEYLAFHTYGNTGKLLVELGIIGFLVGTAIAFFVVMGDLGPPLLAEFTGIEQTANLRLVILTGLGLFVALPLSLLRNIESLQVICATSIIFYLVVVFRVVLEAVPTFTSMNWLDQVNIWRPAGMLQCFPIFSMALACQTNVFEVYATLPDASLPKMNQVIKGAVNLCSGLYITIGFFGYIAFCGHDFGGNILTSFTEHSRFIGFLKLGFVIAVAFSFPLVIFPCRTSIHSLIFRKTYQGIGSTELVNDYMPPTRFNLITLFVISVALVVGIIIPDIELVLGLVGSTMGASICVIFPAVAFLKLTSKNTTERLAARGVLAVGIITLILGTYVNLVERSSSSSSPGSPGSPGPSFIKPKFDANPLHRPKDLSDEVEQKGEELIKKLSNEVGKDVPSSSSSSSSSSSIKNEELKNEKNKEVKNDNKETRIEPVVPEEPEDTKSVEKKDVPDSQEHDDKKLDVSDAQEHKDQKDVPNILEHDEKKKFVPDALEHDDKKNANSEDVKENLKVKEPGKAAEAEDQPKPEKEYAAAELLEELARQKKEQEIILDQQKQILNQLKEHQLKETEGKAVVQQQQQQQQQPGNQQPAEQQAPAVQQQYQQQQINMQQQYQKPAEQQPIVQQQQQIPVQQQYQQLAEQQPPLAPEMRQQPVVQQQQAIGQQQQLVQQQFNVKQQHPPQSVVQQQPTVQEQQVQQQPVIQPQPIIQQQQVVQQNQPVFRNQQQLNDQQQQPVFQQQPLVQQQPVAHLQQQSNFQQYQPDPQYQQPLVQQQQPAIQPQQQPAVQLKQSAVQPPSDVQQQQPAVQQQQPAVQQQQPVVQQQQQSAIYQQPDVQQHPAFQQQQQQQQQQPVVQQQQQSAIYQQPDVQQQKQQQPVVQQQQPVLQQQQPVVQQQQQPVVQQPPVFQQQQPVVQQQQPVQQQQQPFVQQQQPFVQQQQPIVQQQPVIQQKPVVQQQQPVFQQQQPFVQQQQPIVQQQPVVPQQPVVQQQQQQAIYQQPDVQQQPTFQQQPVVQEQPVIQQHPEIKQQSVVQHQQQSEKKPTEEIDIPKKLKSPVTIPKKSIDGRDLKSAGGRDLKSARVRREICENDPSCEEKFDRNPLQDSYLDQDYMNLLKLGTRNLLEKKEIKSNSSIQEYEV